MTLFQRSRSDIASFPNCQFGLVLAYCNKVRYFSSVAKFTDAVYCII